jgi:NAD(P)H-dependent FMN reductase
MKRIVVIGASNSSASINQILAKYTADKLRDCELIEIKPQDYNIPIYGIDHEVEHGIPNEINDLMKLFDTVDGFVISLAEHNGSYSVAFKNIFDWLSRIEMNVWKNKPMLLMSTSPGPRGGINVLKAALRSFPYFSANIVADYSLPSFSKNFVDGELIDTELKNQLLEKIDTFQSHLK